MFEGFKSFDRDCDGMRIHGVIGGSGPPLLLLHGYPQTHVLWHLVAPVLAQEFTVIVADLRGYGASEIPPITPDHSAHSKRAMAGDMVTLMAGFGFDTFAVVGHDRGGRVAHRMAMDHPEVITQIAVLDIAPTREMYANTSDAFARAYWHWFFLIQPAPIPEQMILADREAFWLAKVPEDVFAPEALQHYLEAWTPDVVRASCEDYRAAATIDIVHDDADGGGENHLPIAGFVGVKRRDRGVF